MVAIVSCFIASAMPAYAQATSYTLTVNTKYSNGQSITGMWTTLMQNGQVVASGFSPAQFTLVSGQQYTVTVSDYQSTVFERWQDTGSTNPARTIAITQNMAVTALYKVPISFPVIHMSDTTATSGSLTYIGRQINAEYVTPSSVLVGDPIDSITLRLQRVGAPPGTFQVGVFNADWTPKKSFEIRSTSTLSTVFQDYEFKLANNELYTIQSGDRIGVKYNGGSSTSGVAAMIDRDLADPFDGANSYRTRYESMWLIDTGEDLHMTLKQTHAANSRPTAVSQSLTMDENTARTITLAGSDPEGAPIKFYIASSPAHGTLGVVNQASKTVTYRPYDYYDGPDSFTFVASDGSLDSSPATVSITVANTVSKTTSDAVVITVNPQGRSVTGFWTTLVQNGNEINGDYTHLAFSVNNGQQYVISPTPSFGNSVFDHWQDNGSKNPSRAISIAKDAPFIAVYRTQ